LKQEGLKQEGLKQEGLKQEGLKQEGLQLEDLKRFASDWFGYAISLSRCRKEYYERNPTY
jgi:hypothetical protein